jgi:hypothetical protein
MAEFKLWGAEGMLSGNSENTTIMTTTNSKTRQFYLSLDVDLTKIETKSHFKDIFLCFNTENSCTHSGILRVI